MNRQILSTVVALTLAMTMGTASAYFVNGSFENGLTGWNTSIPGGGSIVTAAVGTGGALPIHGNALADLKTDGPGNYTMLWQDGQVKEGEKISGWANFFDAESSDFFTDSGDVIITDLTTAVATTVFSAVAGPGTGLQGWTQWMYTAVSTGAHRILYRVTNAFDSVVDSHLLADHIQVPEPGALALLGLGLLGMSTGRRRKV